EVRLRLGHVAAVVVVRTVENLQHSAFTGADFSIQHDGVCRMNPELARRVAQSALERLRNRQQLTSDPRIYFTDPSSCASDRSILQPFAAAHTRDDLAEAWISV